MAGRVLLCTFAVVSGSVIALTIGAAATTQDSQPKVSITPRVTRTRDATANLRLDVKFVLVPVTVFDDATRRPINDLKRDNFRVLEDGVEQQITSFSREDGPVSLGIAFDTSGSMKARIASSIEALKQFFLTTIKGDEFFAVQFSDEARLLGGFTDEPDEIYIRLGVAQPKGWTALLDAVALAVHQMRFAKHRKVLLVLSDGNDNNSRYSESEIRSMVIESDMRVYAVALNYSPAVLRRLAQETGGDVLVARNMGELPDVVQRLSAEIRSQYLLSYVSEHHNDGKYHRIKVELLTPAGSPPLYASWRRGYYAGVE